MYRISRGLQFYTFIGIWLGIKRRMIDLSKKITFYLFEKMFENLQFFKVGKVLLWCKIKFREKYQYGYQKNAKFYANHDSKTRITGILALQGRVSRMSRSIPVSVLKGRMSWMCESSSTVLKNLKQRRCILGSVVEPEPDTRGLQFILFWNWIRNQTENDRYWQKITF